MIWAIVIAKHLCTLLLITTNRAKGVAVARCRTAIGVRCSTGSEGVRTGDITIATAHRSETIRTLTVIMVIEGSDK